MINLTHLLLERLLDADYVLLHLDSGICEVHAALAGLLRYGETIKVAISIVNHHHSVLGGSRAAVILIEDFMIGLERREDLYHPVYARRLLLDE